MTTGRGPNDVVLVSWPTESALAERLGGLGLPRLLIVDESAEPPTDPDPLSDWVRDSAPERERNARIATLRARSSAAEDQAVELDDKGLVRFRGKWISLPPVEARLIGELISDLGAVVSRDRLATVGWPTGLPGRNALDVHVLRLRRRIEPLGLVIRTVRSQGYVLEPEQI